MTDFVAEYQSLGRRREGIVSRIAVLAANEERKREERETLEAELRAAGIDPTKPEEEIARLTRELEHDRNTIEKQLDDIEDQLNPKVSPPVPSAAQEAPNPVDVLKDVDGRQDEPDTPVEAAARAHMDEPVSLDDDILID